MTEAEARQWLERADVPRETLALLDRFVRLLLDENARQNLISRGSVESLWARHVVDSAQLVRLAPASGLWADVGTGAGFPGIVVALLRTAPTLLIEPRARRAAFLSHAVEELGLGGRVSVFAQPVERLAPTSPAAIVSARAVASLETLFARAAALADPATLWLLPKGRSAANELDAARGTWQGRFELVPSITDPEAAIVVAREIRPRKRR